MRIINIIEQSTGIIENVTSFGIWEEQLSQDIVKKAKEFFKEQLLKNVNFDEDELEEMESAIEIGYFSENGNNYYTIDFIWSELN